MTLVWEEGEDGWEQWLQESSDRAWSIGEWNGKALQYCCLENLKNYIKNEQIGH